MVCLVAFIALSKWSAVPFLVHTMIWFASTDWLLWLDMAERNGILVPSCWKKTKHPCNGLLGKESNNNQLNRGYKGVLEMSSKSCFCWLSQERHGLFGTQSKKRRKTRRQPTTPHLQSNWETMMKIFLNFLHPCQREVFMPAFCLIIVELCRFLMRKVVWRQYERRMKTIRNTEYRMFIQVGEPSTGTGSGSTQS